MMNQGARVLLIRQRSLKRRQPKPATQEGDRKTIELAWVKIQFEQWDGDLEILAIWGVPFLLDCAS
jgi:hypothetical protein